MDFWINPEIERSREAGTLPEDFALSAAQVILDPGADELQVRLNEEVKAAALVRGASATSARARRSRPTTAALSRTSS
jgi:hypothetical protein